MFKNKEVSNFIGKSKALNLADRFALEELSVEVDDRIDVDSVISDLVSLAKLSQTLGEKFNNIAVRKCGSRFVKFYVKCHAKPLFFCKRKRLITRDVATYLLQSA